jgi:RNA 3'-terminal phosphate cyclase (ATP)
VVHFGDIRAGFSSLGEKRKRAELVGKEAATEALEFIRSDGALEPHLADQILLPAALAGGESRFSASRITRHLTTNAWVVGEFLDVSIEIRGEEGEPGELVVRT